MNDIQSQFRLIKHEIGRALSNYDIDNWLVKNNKRCAFSSYDTLNSDMDLNELFKGYDSLILLYNIQGQNAGHWCALLYKNKNIVEFFDPYASPLDYNLKYSSNKFPVITDILLKNGIKNVIFNNMQVQRMDNNVSTCGRWCALRVFFKNLSLEQFQNALVKSGYPSKLYDYYVYLLTADI